MSNELALKPLVCCIWDDAHGDVGSEASEGDTRRDFHEPVVYHTFGLLVVDDERGVTVAQDFCAKDNTFRGRTFIPKGMIKELIFLGVPKRPRVRKSTAPSEAPSAT